MADKEYIERGALLKTPPFTKYGGDLSDAYTECYLDCAEDARMTVKCSPAADVVEVRHSQWDEDKYPFCNVCPECGLIIDRTCIKRNSGKLNLCPNCGAKMDGERKEQT